LPIWVALAVVVSAGLLHGFRTDRWSTPSGADAVSAQLDSIPMAIGDWVGEPLELTARARSRAEIQSYVLRRYVQQRTGTEVSMMLVCGRGGPIAVHTPEVCFPGAGYQITGGSKRHEVALPSAGAPSEFWVSKFRKGEGGVAEHMLIFWSWNATGAWQAPDNPRLSLAHHSRLFKLYVCRQAAVLDQPLERDPATDFLNRLMPQVEKALAAGS
jgi:hypothetical protein